MRKKHRRVFRLVLAVMGLVVFIEMGASSIASAQVTPADNPTTDFYGAIAYSKATGRFGSSWNQVSRENAENEAMTSCGRADCRVRLWFQNGCGGLAVANNGGHAWNLGRSLYEAKLLTSNRCTSKHGSCKLVCSVCSRGNVP